MSFGDISASRGNQNGFNTGADRDTLAQLKSSLAQFQKSCLGVKEKVTEMRRRKVSQAEKSQLDQQIKDLKVLETQLKMNFDNKFKEIDAMPKSDGAMQRATVSKLFKDYERLKVSLEGIQSESQLIKIQANAGGAADGFSRTNQTTTTSSSSSSSYHYEHHEHREQSQTQTQKLDIKPLVQLQDIDEIILEERERDIKKINEDLAMVNDMFERMAAIVEEQGGHVEKIHEATEQSHEKAQQGLEQVKQAAAYQPGCAIC